MISRACAIGHLHLLWYWTEAYAPEGDLRRFGPDDISAGAEWEGDPAAFVAALCNAGFLEGDGSYRVHDWTLWKNGVEGLRVGGRRRAANASRDAQGRFRIEGMDAGGTVPARLDVPGDGPAAASAGDPSIPAGQSQPPTLEVKGEGKVKGEVQDTPSVSQEPRAQVSVEPAGFAEFYDRFPRQRHRRQAVVAYERALSRGATPATILSGLVRLLPDFASRSADKVPYPKTWLNADGWMDEPDQVNSNGRRDDPAARTFARAQELRGQAARG